MKSNSLVSLLTVLALVAGCSVSPVRTPAPVSKPAPSEQRLPQSPASPADGDGVEIRAYESPAPVQATTIHGKAVTALLENAARQEQAGDFTAAAATLERALRIEPRNGHLWNRLANLRLGQGQYGAAADLAARSNTLAAGDLALRRDNWGLIARARRAAGDIAGARAAERKAQLLH